MNNLLFLTLHPGKRQPAGHEAGVPGEPQDDEQEEADEDIGLREGEGPQLLVLLPQHLVGSLLLILLYPAAAGVFTTREYKDEHEHCTAEHGRKTHGAASLLWGEPFLPLSPRPFASPASQAVMGKVCGEIKG